MLRTRIGEAAIIYNPIVQRAVVFELQCANGVRDTFVRVLDWMSKVVHGINAPFVPRVVVSCVQHAINYRIAHVDVGRSHIDFCTQNFFAVGKLAVTHIVEQLKVLFHRSVAEGTFLSCFGERSAALANFLRRFVRNVR